MFGLLRDIFGGNDREPADTNIRRRIDNKAISEGSNLVLKIEDVFTLGGGRVVVTGEVVNETILVGDSVSVNGVTTNIESIEHSKAKVQFAHPGQKIGLILSPIHENQLVSGDVIMKVVQ